MNLPVLNNPAAAADRTEFGFRRTSCACRSCSIHCEYQPGFLLPDDVTRIADKLGFLSLVGFARKYLLASSGWVVGVTLPGGERTLVNVPSIVAGRKPNGHCVFLDDAKRCSIHEVSPFGCAFFDSHMDDAEGQLRSRTAMLAVAKVHDERGDYAKMHAYLVATGRVAPPAAENRAKLKAACAAEGITT